MEGVLTVDSGVFCGGTSVDRRLHISVLRILHSFLVQYLREKQDLSASTIIQKQKTIIKVLTYIFVSDFILQVVETLLVLFLRHF